MRPRPTAQSRNHANGYVGTAAVAAALGVGVSTVKRWVNDGILPAHVTAGGHRKLLVADVERLVRAGHLPQADLSRLVRVRKKPGVLDFDALAAELVQALKLGDLAGVRRVLHGAYRQGRAPFARIADRILAPALAEIGHGWQTGQLDVMHEHRATQLCKTALFGLVAELEASAARELPTAIGGAPALDYYTLPSLSAQLALLDAGWRAINIGPNTPLPSFQRAIEEFRPKLVWLSVSFVHDADKLERDCAKLSRSAADIGAALAVGGSAVARGQVRAESAAFVGQSIEALAEFAATLCPRPQRPKRGRPKRPE